MADRSRRSLVRRLPSLPREAVVGLIRLYQMLLSPLLGRNCRFYPTCSEYAIEAVRRKGLFLGSVKALWRLLRCHPLSPGGYDPVEGGCESGRKDARGGDA